MDTRSHVTNTTARAACLPVGSTVIGSCELFSDSIKDITTNYKITETPANPRKLSPPPNMGTKILGFVLYLGFYLSS